MSYILLDAWREDNDCLASACIFYRLVLLINDKNLRLYFLKWLNSPNIVLTKSSINWYAIRSTKILNGQYIYSLKYAGSKFKNTNKNLEQNTATAPLIANIIKIITRCLFDLALKAFTPSDSSISDFSIRRFIISR